MCDLLCSASAAAEDEDVCKYDTCFLQRFYPWTSEYQGYDSNNLEASFVLLLLVFTYALVTHPWYDWRDMF